MLQTAANLIQQAQEIQAGVFGLVDHVPNESLETSCRNYLRQEVDFITNHKISDSEVFTNPAGKSILEQLDTLKSKPKS